MSFDALLSDLDALDTLQKARPPQHQEPDADDAGGQPDGDADDAAIRAAASGDADADGSSDGDDLPELDDQKGKKKKAKKPEQDENEDEEEYEYLGKAFAMTDADGQTVHAYDGTALIKSLHQRIVTHENDIRAVLEKTTDMLKALHNDLRALKEQGRGRKTVLNMHDKQSSVGHFSSPAQKPQDLLSKALVAQRNGKITGHDVARIESSIHRGMAVPADLVEVIN